LNLTTRLSIRSVENEGLVVERKKELISAHAMWIPTYRDLNSIGVVPDLRHILAAHRNCERCALWTHDRLGQRENKMRSAGFSRSAMRALNSWLDWARIAPPHRSARRRPSRRLRGRT